jgi:3-deoxy-manno-octulosonate cytidylyltransferase (CMP-KDO synthetase)
MPGPFILAVIPARFESTRLPGKVLLKIGSKTMLERVWERAKLSRADQVIIATDHPGIRETSQYFGATVVMTDRGHPSGTDRVSQAAEQFNADVVVNVQGDEPFIEPSSIDAAIDGLLSSGREVVMSTLMTRFRTEEDADDPSAVKVVTDRNGLALYFSRLPVPFLRDSSGGTTAVWYKHLGLYCYRREFLRAFPKLPRGPLETSEKLEQLRVLENGYRICVVETEHDSIGVDTEDDLARACERAKEHIHHV